MFDCAWSSDVCSSDLQLDAQETAAGVLLATAQEVLPLAEADLHFPISIPGEEPVERERSAQVGEPLVAGQGRHHGGLDHSSSPRPRDASSWTSFLTSCDRSFGI